MQIFLTQNEIKDALHQYVATKGIALVGKKVDISFTAGRKESGLTAEVTIEEPAIPGTDRGDPEKPSLSVVPLGTKAEVVTDAAKVVPAGTSLFN